MQTCHRPTNQPELRRGRRQQKRWCLHPVIMKPLWSSSQMWRFKVDLVRYPCMASAAIHSYTCFGRVRKDAFNRASSTAQSAPRGRTKRSAEYVIVCWEGPFEKDFTCQEVVEVDCCRDVTSRDDAPSHRNWLVLLVRHARYVPLLVCAHARWPKSCRGTAADRPGAPLIFILSVVRMESDKEGKYEKLARHARGHLGGSPNTALTLPISVRAHPRDHVRGDE